MNKKKMNDKDLKELARGIEKRYYTDKRNNNKLEKSYSAKYARGIYSSFGETRNAVKKGAIIYEGNAHLVTEKSPTIRIAKPFHSSKKELEDTLVHEMLHAHRMIRNKDDAHGPRFMAGAQKLNEKAQKLPHEEGGHINVKVAGGYTESPESSLKHLNETEVTWESPTTGTVLKTLNKKINPNTMPHPLSEYGPYEYVGRIPDDANEMIFQNRFPAIRKQHININEEQEPTLSLDHDAEEGETPSQRGSRITRLAKDHWKQAFANFAIDDDTEIKPYNEAKSKTINFLEKEIKGYQTTPLMSASTLVKYHNDQTFWNATLTNRAKLMRKGKANYESTDPEYKNKYRYVQKGVTEELNTAGEVKLKKNTVLVDEKRKLEFNKEDLAKHYDKEARMSSKKKMVKDGAELYRKAYDYRVKDLNDYRNSLTGPGKYEPIRWDPEGDTIVRTGDGLMQLQKGGSEEMHNHSYVLSATYANQKYLNKNIPKSGVKRKPEYHSAPTREERESKR